MWNRQEVKTKGKENFKKNYWKSVLVAFIYSLFFAATGSVSANRKEELSASFSETVAENPSAAAFLAVAFAIMGIAIIVLVLADIFILNPIEVGCERFFLKNQDEQADWTELTHFFKNNYLNVVFATFLKSALICLGSILFVIPGLILNYSYRLVPYILSDDPTIDAVGALKKSRAMMSGHKWSAFVYDLSFILWIFLGCITCGIVSLFYVNPYKRNADAALYQAIKGNN